MTQAALAAAVGWERSTIASVERGHDAPSRELLEALAEQFKVSVDWLLKGSPGKEPERAQTEREAALLQAFRDLQEPEQNALLTLAIRRAEKPS